MIAVTGTTGLIGGNLVRALLAQGQPVRALLHQDQRGLDGLDVERMNADILNPNSLCKAFQGVDMVFHCAGLISLRPNTWNELEAINVTGTHNVVQACLNCGVKRLVHFSSIQALTSERSNKTVDENRPLVDSPHAPPYNRSKAFAEREVLSGIEKGLDAVILYPTAVVGPFDFKPSFVGQTLLLLAKGQLPGLVKGGFNWVDVRDVAAGAIEAGVKAHRGERYILSGHWHSVVEVATMVANWAGIATPRLMVPFEVAWLVAPFLPAFAPLAHIPAEQIKNIRNALEWLQVNRQVSHTHANQELNYQPRPFQETITDTLDWFEQNGTLKKTHE